MNFLKLRSVSSKLPRNESPLLLIYLSYLEEEARYLSKCHLYIVCHNKVT